MALPRHHRAPVAILGRLGPSNGAIIILIFVDPTLASRSGHARGALEARSVRREIFGYGCRSTGTLTQFFNYRIDALIAFLIATGTARLLQHGGRPAELVFFPERGITLFFTSPGRDAGSTARSPGVRVTPRDGCRRDPDDPGRGADDLTLLAFGPSIPPYLVLLPGVVVLSVTKVVSGYVSGIGRPAITSYINVSAFVINIVANLVLIPRFGIVGASAASLGTRSPRSVFMAAAARLT
jgi:hypothetical protein